MFRFLRNIFKPRVVYVPSRRKAAFKDYDARKAETTAALRRAVASRSQSVRG